MSSSENPYNWNFINEVRPWATIHLVQPFNVYMITQNAWLTIFLFYFFETVEVIVLTICGGSYCAWGGGTVGERFGDSLIGDILQGFLGLYLAIAFRTVTNAPRWEVYFRDSIVGKYHHLWWKRFFFLVLMFGTAAIANFETTTLAWGTWIMFGAQILLLIIFGFWNRTRDDRLRFWKRNGSFDANAYEGHYFGWALSITLLLSSAFYMGFSDYYQSWIHAGAYLLLIIVWGIATRRERELLDVLSFGLYSLGKGEQSTFIDNGWDPDSKIDTPLILPDLKFESRADRIHLVN